MLDQTPSVAAIIVTWNGKAYAIECLDSLRKNAGGLALQTIVVDNASTDGTPEAVRDQYPEVRLIHAGANLGFAKANNLGMRVSDADYVCLINSDVVVPAQCLETMIEFMEKHPDIGMLGPKMLAPGGGTGDSVMRLPTVWNTLCSAMGLHRIFKTSKWLGGYMMSGFPYDRTADVEVLTGWFWMIRKSALEQVGGLDEQFFMYGEDIDWSYRFLKAGWRVVYYADAEALHYGAASSRAAPARFYVEMRRANLQYFKKHHGRLAEFGYRLVLFVHEAVRIIVHGAHYLIAGPKRKYARSKVATALACFGWLVGITPIPRAR
jgi:GT2 family glycosyltransferase